MKVRELGEFIRNQRRATGVSLRKLAAVTGVSNPYLSQIERGLRRPSADMLQAIAKGLRVSAQTLYVKAGILEEETRADVQAAVMGDPGLTERQKQALIAVYESFREETAGRRGASKNDPAEEPLTTAAKTIVRDAAARGRSRSTTGGRAETQAVPKPSPGSPSPSRSPSSRKAASSGSTSKRATARTPAPNRTRTTPKGGATTR